MCVCIFMPLLSIAVFMWKQQRKVYECTWSHKLSTGSSNRCMEASLSLLWKRFFAEKKILERFSNRRKTSAKVITPTNHNRRKQRDEPIRMCRNVTCLSAGKIVPTRCNLVWFCFSLVEKLARRFSQSLSAAIAIVLFLSTVIWEELWIIRIVWFTSSAALKSRGGKAFFKDAKWK